MSAHFTEISVRTRYAELSVLLEAIARQAAELGINGDDTKRLQLVAEELFINTVSHGHGGDSDHAVRLALGRNGPAITLRYEDEAPPFDFTEIARNFESTVALGGLGISLIRGLSKTLRHAYRDGRNVTEMEF